MTIVYDPLTYLTVVARPGEIPYKFWSVNKHVIDAASAGICTLHSGDEAPGDTSRLWLDLTLPESAVGAVKAYSGGSWVALTPALFATHIGAVSGVTWGSITGTLSSQTDLQTALDTKLDDSQATAFGLSLLDDADAAAGRTTLGLGTMATETATDYLTTAAASAGYQPLDADLTALAGLTYAQGDILYYNGSALVNLGPGTSGHFLKTQGAAANPIWAAVPGGGDALTANTLAQFAATTSLQLKNTISDETGGGALVFADGPQMATIELGHATDTTLARASAGNVSIEGNLVYRAGGTDVPVADGGTGASTAEGARANLSAASFDAGAALGLLTNPFFEISQENGTTAGAAAAAYYAADQWFALEDSDAVLSVQNVASPFSGTATLKRLQRSFKATATTADASLSASQYIQTAIQFIEGTFWRSLGWGTADARAVDVVFIAQCSVTGTYPVSIRAADGSRSYVTTVALTANTPTVCMVTIPGDTSGTWVTTSAGSAILNLGSVSGTTFHAASLDTWAASNSFSHSTCTNWAASGTTSFFQVGYCQIFPAGVLPFTSAAEITGEALQLLLNMRRPYDVEFARCQRYFQLFPDCPGQFVTTTISTVACAFTVPMRSTPTATLITGTSGIVEPNVAFRTISSIYATGLSNIGGYLDFNVSSSGTVQNMAVYVASNAQVNLSARM